MKAEEIGNPAVGWVQRYRYRIGSLLSAGGIVILGYMIQVLVPKFSTMLFDLGFPQANGFKVCAFLHRVGFGYVLVLFAIFIVMNEKFLTGDIAKMRVITYSAVMGMAGIIFVSASLLQPVIAIFGSVTRGE